MCDPLQSIISNDAYRFYMLQDRFDDEERDLDFCVPSTMLTPLLSKWQLVFTPFDSDQIFIARAAPARWYTAEGFGIDNAPARLGSVSFNVTSPSSSKTSVTVTFTPVKRAPVAKTLVVRVKNAGATAAQIKAAAVYTQDDCASVSSIAHATSDVHITLTSATATCSFTLHCSLM
ncbi:hypothetical protein PTSG_01587 [Salpingoeca rosetta]|uniref:Uncharacterized protein n=1 Tax=Salpingoeca rosetta (strain ATCC 50818 / BSB-021) TaxID=946362 RepID=F2TYD6_SALR5|nr:uncharacterized protein PTSG_01587 [Salpingoeca rosetta]EGD78610.1 hypothetical protein PTSG_01587 [Salpingoeca rosetta]|eukprot:XP_004997568.1 hypothetical protein PTSG_01587 [Salpingoeca rosetta]